MQAITLYVTERCPFCHSAKRFLQSKGLGFEEIALDNDPALRQSLSQQQNGWRTVPMIFVGEHFIGGYTDLVALDKSGELKKLLTTQ